MGEWTLPKADADQGEQSPVKFVWPPRALSVEYVPAVVEVSAPSTPPTRGSRPQTRPPTSAPTSLPERALSGSRLARVWSEIEHTWLDVVASPLAERMAEEYWSPDVPKDYCCRCAVSVGLHEAVDGQCAACQAGESTRAPWQRIIRLGEYESPLNRWICEVKFTRWRKLGWDLGRVLGRSIHAQMQEALASGLIPPGPPIIVPVPMSWQRRWHRGIDHTLAIARGVAAETGGVVCQPLVRKHRPSQTQVVPSGREANVAGTFRPRGKWLLPRLGGGLIIVVDDVTTTTSTLRGACRAVGECLRNEQKRQKGSSRVPESVVWGAVLARTPPESHDGATDTCN